MNEVWLSILAAAATFLITWGATSERAKDQEKRLSKNEGELEKLKRYMIESRESFSTQIHSLRDVYVGYHHFEEAMKAMRDNYKDVKEDLSKILDLLSAR